MQFGELFKKNAVLVAVVAAVCWLCIAQSGFAGTIVGWDPMSVDSGKLDLSDFVAIAGGEYHSLGLKSDGALVGWGYNNYGQAAPPDGNDFVAIAGGMSHSLAATANATLVEWLVSEGGNGHFYEAIAVPEGISWTDASEAANLKGGYLVTITSQAENDFVHDLINDAMYWGWPKRPMDWRLPA